jgi:hypothetical protein
MPIRVETGERGQDPPARVRDQHRVVVGEQCAVVPQKAQQMWHLLEIGRHVRVVPQEVRVIELQVDDVLNVTLRRAQLTASGRSGLLAI